MYLVKFDFLIVVLKGKKDGMSQLEFPSLQ